MVHKVGTVDMDHLYHCSKLTKNLSNDNLSEWENGGWWDFGTYQYYAYKFNPENRMYEVIFLYAFGDSTRRNLSEGADEIRSWLTRVL